MGGLAERQIADAVRGLAERDAELAEHVIATDPTIDALQHEIEEKAILTIARRQPMAVDAASQGRWLVGIIIAASVDHDRVALDFGDREMRCDDGLRSLSGCIDG
jgi:hypothetical protein